MLIRNTIIIVIISITLLLCSFGYFFNKAISTALPIADESFITIKPGSSVTTVAKQLVDNAWIDDTLWIRVYCRLFPEKSAVKAGTYLISPNVNLVQLLAQLVDGKEHQFSVTFIEGTLFKDALVQLAQHPHIQKTLTNKKHSEIARLLNIKASNPEGWLFPDTYAFTAGDKDLAILKRAYQKMKENLANTWQSRDKNLPYKTPYQALIMASIIEKESSHIAEQPMIASVFVNRLHKGMRLQTDPTVIYGLGDRYQGDITWAHLREKTLYNTYRINGLPPTPIAMAGLSALQAALKPANSEYYYFVSNGNGQHVFSKSLKEHNAAVKNYLKIQKAKG